VRFRRLCEIETQPGYANAERAFSYQLVRHQVIVLSKHIKNGQYLSIAELRRIFGNSFRDLQYQKAGYGEIECRQSSEPVLALA